jgi:two-component system NarL family response regulator
MKPVRVLVADKKELFREGLVRLLEEQPDIEVVCQCENNSDAIERVRETEPHVVLMDLEVTDGRGVELVRSISEELPQAKVAMLTDCEDEGTLLDALQAGAKGYMPKDVSVTSLAKSIDLLSEGEVVVSPPIAQRLLEDFAVARGERETSDPQDSHDLSEREVEVLRLIAKGATTKEIASQLVIAENTAKVHARNVLGKLGLRNRQQAAAYAIKAGFVTDAQRQE